MMNAVKMTTAAALLALLGGCSTLQSMNPFASGKLKPAALASFKQELNVANRWSVDVGDSETGHFTPVAYNNIVYAASEEGRITAIDKATGKVRWQIKTDTKLKAGVAATIDTIVALDANNQLLAFDSNGKAKWKINVGAEVTSVPTAASGTILVRSIDFSVIAFSSDTGAQRWKYSRQLPPLTLRINATVDVNNARVYAGFPGGRLVGLDLNNGNVVWEGLLTSPSGTTEIERIADITGNPVYNFREVCAAAFQGKVGCLDAVNGRSLWNAEFSSPNGASVDDRYLITSNELGDLFAFSRSGGKQVWRVPTFQRRLPTAPLVVGRAVAVGDFEGYVHFIDRDTGKTIARTQVGSKPFTGQPQSADNNQVLVQSRKGSLALITVQ